MDPHLEAWIEAGGTAQAWYEHQLNLVEQDRDKWMELYLDCFDKHAPVNPYDAELRY